MKKTKEEGAYRNTQVKIIINKTEGLISGHFDMKRGVIESKQMISDIKYTMFGKEEDHGAKSEVLLILSHF